MLCVSPAFQRKSIASALLEHWIEKVSEIGVNRFFLEVAENNSPAIGLYRSLNFDVVGHRPNYYSQPNKSFVDALVMQRITSDSPWI